MKALRLFFAGSILLAGYAPMDAVGQSEAVGNVPGAVPGVERAGPAVLANSIHLDKLPLFLRRGNHLVQPVKLAFTLSWPVPGLTVRLRVNGATTETALDGSRAGGVERTLQVPEITEPGKIELELRAGERLIQALAVPVKPDRKWTIYVVPQAHVDIGYTDLQEKAMEVHRHSNDVAVKLIDQYPEFTWSVESSYVMKGWLASRPAGLVQRFFQLARSHRIEIGAFYGNLLTGLLSDEEAFRALYYSKGLSREYGTSFRSATLTDAPSHIWSIPSLLRQSGIKYLSMGINQTRAPLLRGGLNKRSPVWWKGPDGSRVLAFFHNHYAWAGKVGLTEAWNEDGATRVSLKKAEDRIPWLLGLYDRPDYPFTAIHLHGAYGDNRPLTEQLPATVHAWNKKYAYPKIVFSTNEAWFERMERDYGDQLDTVSGDGGAYWEDGAGSSARETALNRRNQQEALWAEMMLAGLHAQHRIQTDYRGAFQDIWHSILLYDEHTWGAHNSVSDPELPAVKQQFRNKAKFAQDAHEHLRPLLEKAREFLPATPPDAEPGWRFDGVHLRTPFYDVRIDGKRGGIASIVDRENGEELLDPKSAYLCGQVIYARGEKPPYDFSVATLRKVAAVDEGVQLDFTHPMLPAIRLTLRPDARAKRLEFRYDIDKVLTYEKEGVYIAFPFNGRRPQVDYAVANAVVRAGRDWLPGACKDWFTLQNWLRIRNQGMDTVWVTFDSPLVNLQGIHSNEWLKELPIENGHVYAYIMNNYWFTNYKAGQGGSFRFRFALTSGRRISAAAAARFGRDWTPAERGAMDQMISVSPDAILLSAFKRSEDGRAYVVRLREMSGHATTASLRIPALANLSAAYLANGVEDILGPLPVRDGAISLRLKPWEVATVQVRP